jgi:hypothetical protein
LRERKRSTSRDWREHRRHQKRHTKDSRLENAAMVFA